MWVTDVVAKRRGFMAAYRGEARLAPCEYPGCDRSLRDNGFHRCLTCHVCLVVLPGESLQNFQWAGEFGDRRD